MQRFVKLLVIATLICGNLSSIAQETKNPSLLTIDRIYSGEFRLERARPIQWIEGGNAYVTIEKSEDLQGSDELIRYNSSDKSRSLFVQADALLTDAGSLVIEDFSLSPDASKVLIFTNSSRVWRSNTKGDYWVYDFETGALKQIGTNFEPSSLMFAKFSKDNREVFYVQGFNIYKEDFTTGEITQLTFDGDGDIINGTFDWVYEEEFGKRDGFTLSPGNGYLAYWQLDASEIGTFYMINNTDSIYSVPIPLQYPKVGFDPSAARIGVIDLETRESRWIDLPGMEKENYIPGIQWINEDLLLIQQLNRLQNTLKVWSYDPWTKKLNLIYTEAEESWVDISYPDVTADHFADNDLPLVEDGTAFLRMTETDDWRHVYKVDIASGKKTLITPFDFDVASLKRVTNEGIYFIASPGNSTQRYLWYAPLDGTGNARRITPDTFSGINDYNIAPNGKYAMHTFEAALTPLSVSLIDLPDHDVIERVVENDRYAAQLDSLSLPEVRFEQVATADGIVIDARMILPPNFDEGRKYPVLFFVYGEPASQVGTDSYIGLWNIMMAQKGYVVIAMDNRGTPCLKGSEWRKSIYRKVGRINVNDQGHAAREMLKRQYLDSTRVAVWGWSGGGSMTLGLLFNFPEVYHTGVAVAPVSSLFVYDNIYTERYMGLPQENREDYIAGSALTHAKNLKGNLLLVHGTGDDNVHYQSAELLINELVRHNIQFDMMAYPNRSHGIYEGQNTRKHLFTMITNYITSHCPPITNP